MQLEFRQLNLSDRIEIQKLYPQRKKAEIAKALNYHKSTITREINGKSVGGKYDAVVAQKITDAKSRQKTIKAPRYNALLITFINSKLVLDWSPEQISGYLRLRQHKLRCVCHETIYQMIYSNIVSRKPKYRLKKLRSRRKPRLQKSTANIVRKSIDARPEVINNRERYCDWEGDLIVGKSNKGAVATMVERKSGFLLTGLMYGKTSNEFMITIRDMFAPFDNDFLKSITYDNGSESAGFISIEEFLHCDFYFAYPAAPWQRGTNENTNGLLRRYFPKKTKFRNVCPKLLDEITELINCRPRKRLSYRTPLEVLLKQGLRL